MVGLVSFQQRCFRGHFYRGLLRLQRQMDVNRHSFTHMDDYTFNDHSLEAALAGRDLISAWLEVWGDVNSSRVGGVAGCGFGVHISHDNTHVGRWQPLWIGDSSDDRSRGGLRRGKPGYKYEAKTRRKSPKRQAKFLKESSGVV